MRTTPRPGVSSDAAESAASRPIILTFTNRYLPGYRAGGPVRTIANLVACLGDEFDFRIVCEDRDYGDTRPYPGVKIDAWNAVGRAQVFYASRRTRAWRGLRKLLCTTPHDVLYLNSFFSPESTIRPLVLRALHRVPRKPLIVAPRGEFADDALKLKALRKTVYVALARRFSLYGEAHWQASSAFEAADIARRFHVSRATITEARDMVAPTSVAGPAADREPTGPRARPLRIGFLSRITPMKNLDFAIKVLSLVKTEIDFSIAGPVSDDAYWRQCEEALRRLPANISAHYDGAVNPEDVVARIAAHDLFFVPTRGENFGHVFMEAWSAGVPVLMSDRTQWRGLQEHEIGWDLPLDDPTAFVEVIESFARVPATERAAMRAACLEFARSQANSQAVIEANRELFLSALRG